MSEDRSVTDLEARIQDLEKQLDSVREELKQTRLEQWEGRIDDLEVQAHLGSMELNERMAPIVEAMRNRWLDAKAQLDSASTNAGEAFEALRKGLEQSVRDIKEAVAAAKSSVTS